MYEDECTEDDPRIDPNLELGAIAESLPAHRSRRTFDLDGKGEMYLRRSKRTFEIEETEGLDIARVEVNKDSLRTGVFSTSAAIVEDAARQMGLGYVFVENIGNAVLVLAVAKMGYTVFGEITGPFDANDPALSEVPCKAQAYKMIR
jgi:hypothetical protein